MRSTARTLTTVAGVGVALVLVGGPSASNDGERTGAKAIAYFHMPNPYSPASAPPTRPTGIYVMDADGRNDHRISAGLGFSFSWSPTGSRLVVDGDGGIYVVNRDGGGMQRIAAETSGATWAPDETRIAFAHWEEGLRVVG